MYRTVVTVCTSIFNTHKFYVLPTQCMCFVWIWEQTAIISLYSINWLVCITETQSVYCAVRTGSLYTIQVMCFVWIWKQTAIISLYSINWQVCITETASVHCSVRTGSLHIIQVNFSVDRVKENMSYCGLDLSGWEYTILAVRFKMVITYRIPLNDAHRTTLLLRIGELLHIPNMGPTFLTEIIVVFLGPSCEIPWWFLALHHNLRFKNPLQLLVH